jgi:exopolyphosphatase / guanosine-5'-triphosphate,3'-diphosphate pyrophosphatase
LWNVWRADLPAGAELERAAMEKLRTWATFLDPDQEHSKLVGKLALRLYDDISQCGTPQFAGSSRKILEASAILHEVGRRGQKNGSHQKRGYRMVGKLTPPIGWTEEEMRAVAAIVRHHKGALPSNDESSFVGLTAQGRSSLLALMGILRLANAFDESHNCEVRDVSLEMQDGSLLVSVRGLQELSATAEKVARARYLLESICQRPIMVRALPAQTVPRRPRVRVRKQPAAAR